MVYLFEYGLNEYSLHLISSLALSHLNWQSDTYIFTVFSRL